MDAKPSCPTPDDNARFRLLADYVDGLLDGPEHTAARAEVEGLRVGNADARATERWLRELMRTAGRVPLVARSPLVEQRLRHYFTRWAHAQTVLTRPVPRLTATVVSDSRHDRPLAGARGGADGVSLLYGCDVGELALDVRRGSSGTLTLDGQVLLDAPTASPFFGVSALVAGVRHTTESDALGCFLLTALPALPTTLRLDNGELEIVATVDLGPADLGPADLGPASRR